MTKFDDCNEAVNLLNNVKGSIENKIRTVYNLGYKQGLEDGKIEAVRNVYTWVFKEQAEQTEPNCSEFPNNCETCRHYTLACDLFSEICKYEPKDEPMKTADYCDICKQDMCEDCIADATNPYCVPSHYEINYEPKDEPQTERSE